MHRPSVRPTQIFRMRPSLRLIHLTLYKSHLTPCFQFCILRGLMKMGLAAQICTFCERYFMEDWTLKIYGKPPPTPTTAQMTVPHNVKRTQKYCYFYIFFFCSTVALWHREECFFFDNADTVGRLSQQRFPVACTVKAGMTASPACRVLILISGPHE